MELLVPVLTQAKSSGLKLALHIAEVSQIVDNFVKRMAILQTMAAVPVFVETRLRQRE